MIQSLHLRNFQCHRKFDLELDPHVTILCGSSDRGKSAVLRAFRWLAFNRPTGAAFVRSGQSFSEVRLELAGHSIKRHKGSDRNEYQIDGQVFCAFGAAVPDNVGNLLNLDPALNLQRQHDPPFWFSLTPGEVAKELNRVVNLELIDRTLANAAAEARRIKAVIGVSEERLRKAKGEAERLAWVTGADAALREVESKEAALAKNRDKIAQVAAALEGVRRTNRKLERLTEAKSGGLAAVSAGQAAIDAVERAERLAEAVRNCTETEVKLCEAKKKLADAERELEAVRVCPACGKPR